MRKLRKKENDRRKLHQFMVFKKHILSIFNAPKLKEQPKVIVEFGCGDGQLLRDIYLLIREQTLRGRALAEHELILVGIEQNPDSIKEATRNLADLPAHVIAIALDCPEKILGELNGRITVGKQEILYIQSICSSVFHKNSGEPSAIDTQQLIENHKRMLTGWCRVVGCHGLLIYQSNPVLPQLTENAINSSNNFNNLPNVTIPQGSNVSLESFLILAANVGLFSVGQLTPDLPGPSVYPEIAIHLKKADYCIRQARSSDLPALVELEQQCWSIQLQATSARLADRLDNYPEGQFVLELSEVGGYKVVGSIYSQRIESADLIQNIRDDRISNLHTKHGSVVQLLAVNILPKVQERRLGDLLLEFMLQRYSLIEGIESVVAVTLCKQFYRQTKYSFEEYIQQRNVCGHLIDPILRFHELHGASVERAVEDYRPLDRNNQGYGVLVRYPIHQRRRDDRRITEDNSADAPPHTDAQAWDTELALAFLEASVQSSLDDDKKSGYKFDRPFIEMGLNSVDLLTLSEQISEHFRIDLDLSFFFSHPTPAKVLNFLREQNISALPTQNVAAALAAPQSIPSVSLGITTEPSARLGGNSKASSSPGEIAIIGVACRLPTEIDNPEALWELLKNSGSVIQKLPKGRWQWPSDIDPDSRHRGIDYGGFLSHLDRFDASFFHISPTEAQSMDPQQRILMELAWQTLENAGVTAEELATSTTGVFIGASGSDYYRMIDWAHIAIEPHFGTGASLAVLANRISYFFDWRGPSIVIDTACSSSLVAVHQAVQSIGSGECVQALVGGINIICHPANSIAYYKSGMLAHDGKCKTFDDKADGYVRSEGAVMFLLKRLSQAEADGNSIYATIKGSASSHGGQAAGLTVPNPQQQAALLTNAWKSAGVTPNTISFIEVHGTGTALGDPIEIQGIQQAFSEWPDTPQGMNSCGLGSIKTNLGHLEAAAGIVGLLKVVLSMQHHELPATKHFERLNRHIDLSNSPLYIVAQHQKWASANGFPRRAGVSSFGSGGATAHIVVEEYNSGYGIEKTDDQTSEPFLFVLSAENEQRLHDYVDRFAKWLNSLSDEQCPLAELTRFLRNNRQAFDERLALVAENRINLVHQLRKFPDIGESVFHGNINNPRHELKALIRGEYGIQVIQSAIERRDWEQLAILWVSGVSLDWRLLDSNQLLTRSSRPWQFSMPTYPFAQNQFWIPSATWSQSSTQLPQVHLDANDSVCEAELLTLKLVWQPLDISNSLDCAPYRLDSAAVIIGGTYKQKQVLQQHFWQCKSISLSTDAGVEDIVQQINQVGQIAHIIWVGSSNLEELDFPESVLINQASGLLLFYRLLKAVVVLGYEQNLLQWTVITLQSQAVFCAEDIDPTHGGMHGFIGSVAKEFPQWRFRLLDMESMETTSSSVSCTWPVREMFALPFDPEIRTLAWRDGKWYRPALTKLFFQEWGRSAYRAGGVYVIIGGAGGVGEVWSQYLIERYGAQIVWIGRTPFNEIIQRKLNTLAHWGPKPRYISANAANLQELQHAYERIKCEFGSVHGVVHAAVGLFDCSFKNTDEARLQTVLSAKVDVSVRIAQVFQTEDLDFVLFFSSSEALSRSGGLSGYAAGCAFKDAFSQYLTNRWNCAVKAIHWGHWAIGTGARISEASKTRLKQRGIGLLEPDESMRVLEHLVRNHSWSQLTLIKSANAKAIDWYDDREVIISFEEMAPSVIHEIHHIDLAPKQPIGQLQADGIFQCKHMRPLLVRLLRASLDALSLHSIDSVPDFYTRWLAASRSILAQQVRAETVRESLETVWQAWNEARCNWSEPNSKQQAFSLVESCVRNLPEILSGQKRAVDVLFPNGSLQLVEGIYSDNSVADYFNDGLAKLLLEAIKVRLKYDPHARLRILEIGAGTGATTKRVLSKLAELEDSISEYRYTDISKAFLWHAQEELMLDRPFIQVGLFDVEKPLADQEIEMGTYDFVVATNVLHATCNIRQTIRNVKACLRTNGLIFLNELCEQTLFGHLTFGLLEGWWRSEDPELRIYGTPLLSVSSWVRVLQTEGFQSPWLPTIQAQSLGQQIIIAQSDGLVRQSRASVGNNTTPRTRLKSSGQDRYDVVATHPGSEYNNAGLREKATQFFQRLIAKILRMEPRQIEADEPFQNYGFDSILVVQLTGALQEVFGEIDSTLLFEVQTLGELVDYFIHHRRSHLIAQLSTNLEHTATADRVGASGSKGLERTIVTSTDDTSRNAFSLKSDTTKPIAIIGMSGRYPRAEDIHAFWECLQAGTDCISEIPQDRWSWKDYFHPNIEVALELGKSYCKWGGFLENAKEFDAQFFGIFATRSSKHGSARANFSASGLGSFRRCRSHQTNAESSISTAGWCICGHYKNWIRSLWARALETRQNWASPYII